MKENKNDLHLNYLYDPDKYSFYQVPKTLFVDDRFKGLSIGAKVLYGLMFEKAWAAPGMGWLDEADRVYIIYPLPEIVTDLGRPPEEIAGYCEELKEIGLIEQREIGYGYPDFFYIKRYYRDAPCHGNQATEKEGE